MHSAIDRDKVFAAVALCWIAKSLASPLFSAFLVTISHADTIFEHPVEVTGKAFLGFLKHMDVNKIDHFFPRPK